MTSHSMGNNNVKNNPIPVVLQDLLSNTIPGCPPIDDYHWILGDGISSHSFNPPIEGFHAANQKNLALAFFGSVSNPFDRLNQPFDQVVNLIVSQCNKNFTRHWIHPQMFPNLKSLIITSHPGYKWLAEQFGDVPTHVNGWYTHVISLGSSVQILDDLTIQHIDNAAKQRIQGDGDPKRFYCMSTACVDGVTTYF
jgi:hypothetical protein